MKEEEGRCWEVHLLMCRARKVTSCMSKPEPQGRQRNYLQDGLGFVGVFLGGLFLLVWGFLLFLHKVKMKNLFHRENSVKRNEVMTDH